MTAALIKGVSDLAVRGLVPVLTGWQLYALLVVGAAGLVIGQISLGAGPLSAALPVAATVDPLVSIVIGVAIYDEKLRLGPGHGSVLAVLLVVLSLAVLRLARLGDPASAEGPDHGGFGVQEASTTLEGVDEPFPAQRQAVQG